MPTSTEGSAMAPHDETALREPALGPSDLIRTPVVPDVAQISTAVIHPDRLLAVARSGLLDTAPDTHFDDLVRLARDVAGGRRAFFTVVDAHRSFWKSTVGVEPGLGREASVEDSLSQIVIATDTALFVEDARSDDRTRSLAAVTLLGIGACIVHPVRDAVGHVIGGLCVTDSEPRTWTASQRRGVATLARAVGVEVQLHRALALSRAQVNAMRDARDEQAALARSLQDSLLPPQLPAIPGIDTAAAYLPAGHGVEVVGDFYDLFETDGRWWAVMGDVCGHGVEAAKLTALARYTIRTEAAHPDATPGGVLRRLHDALLAQHGRTKLVTAAVARLHPGPDGVTGVLCSAGHEPVLIRRADGGIDVPPARGRLLGMTCDVHLPDVDFTLGPGDALVLYTDGVTEARAGRGQELFGDQRLAAVLAQRPGRLDAVAIVDSVLHSVAQHHRGYHPDDTAVMVILA
ncbi:PP2C family protein-serine/threonine phosphatase [Pseudonocardia sp. GCM10023141]|uniref:PP2C family protein-serine/threonine phosphatase n=1 Tax=Pseudonocardia sp. GCM10023141 TaxID=3252653 RepID=UPI00360672BD